MTKFTWATDEVDDLITAALDKFHESLEEIQTNTGLDDEDFEAKLNEWCIEAHTYFTWVHYQRNERK